MSTNKSLSLTDGFEFPHPSLSDSDRLMRRLRPCCPEPSSLKSASPSPGRASAPAQPTVELQSLLRPVIRGRIHVHDAPAAGEVIPGASRATADLELLELVADDVIARGDVEVGGRGIGAERVECRVHEPDAFVQALVEQHHHRSKRRRGLAGAIAFTHPAALEIERDGRVDIREVDEVGHAAAAIGSGVDRSLPRWNIEELADAATTAPHRVRTIGWSRARRCLRSYVQLEPPAALNRHLLP